MKMQKMNQSKFDIFKSEELKNPLLVTGGQIESTTWVSYDVATGNQVGSGKDKWYTGEDATNVGSPLSVHWNTSGDMKDLHVTPGGGYNESDFIESPMNNYTFDIAP